MKGVAQRLRTILGLTLALLVTYSGAASGICAMLCETRVLQGQAECATEPSPDCCKETKQPGEPKNCCEWMADFYSRELGDTAKFQLVSGLDIPAIPLSRALLPKLEPIRQIAIAIPHDERGPPGPSCSPIKARAPPICRV